VVIGLFLISARANVQSTQNNVTYHKGERVTGLSQVRFDKAGKTLLLALRKDCHFCAESMPFYRSVANELAKKTSPGAVQLVVLTSDEIDVSKDYLRANALDTADVVSLSSKQMSSLKLPGTPTLILTDRAGVVDTAWIGKLNDTSEREVLSKLLAI